MNVLVAPVADDTIVEISIRAVEVVDEHRIAVGFGSVSSALKMAYSFTLIMERLPLDFFTSTMLGNDCNA